jgi:hypothetical protein
VVLWKQTMLPHLLLLVRSYKMTRKYNVENVMGQETIWYEENGFRVSFTADPANSDYQEYLKSLEDEA